jgi:cobalamin biosynthesis Mg chelatase CobN
VASAYSVYVEKCGTDLDTIAYNALPAYIDLGNHSDTQIDDPDFENYLDQNVGDWIAAQAVCSSALSDFKGAVAVTDTEGSSASSNSASSSSASTTSASGSEKSGSGTHSGTSTVTKPPSTTSSPTTSTATTTKPNGAVGGERPVWILVTVLGAALIGQALCV